MFSVGNFLASKTEDPVSTDTLLHLYNTHLLSPLTRSHANDVQSVGIREDLYVEKTKQDHDVRRLSTGFVTDFRKWLHYGAWVSPFIKQAKEPKISLRPHLATILSVPYSRVDTEADLERHSVSAFSATGQSYANWPLNGAFNGDASSIQEVLTPQKTGPHC